MVKLCFLAWIMLWMQSGEATIGKSFTLRKSESALVKGTRISVQVLSPGTTQSDEEGDRVYCSAKIRVGRRAESVNIRPGSTLLRSGYGIKLVTVSLKSDRTLPDPWAATSCTFIVTRREK